MEFSRNILIKRFTILSELSPELKKLVNDLPIRIFNKISSFDDPQKYLEMFSSGKLKTYNDLVSYLEPVVNVIEAPKDEFDFAYLLNNINVKLEQKKSKLSKRKIEILQKHINAINKILED